VTKLTKQELYALARVGLSRAVVNDGTELSRAFWLLFPIGRARLREACGKVAE
jgi:hypothetical protein